ncbi:hypothetical protein SODALDRAFT_354410 [Sodiomyces alkalinus F11]|uniref:Uncharacterized protein n=1 Tax=Sodiomyces alkalinus (strain CBS 110278 / VKM F-3762 / F11) TaxID=1314773 RepID=A0A3N2Q672_SODAK|nr:hypothetical protein SODALDRAFT_354410 [Sodiomyces alkalinus F11]ROT42279.1 hypothetical protein SODALDRAFT_354410 [Sodiomyces alkalinus F11]
MLIDYTHITSNVQPEASLATPNEILRGYFTAPNPFSFSSANSSALPPENNEQLPAFNPIYSVRWRFFIPTSKTSLIHFLLAVQKIDLSLVPANTTCLQIQAWNHVPMSLGSTPASRLHAWSFIHLRLAAVAVKLAPPYILVDRKPIKGQSSKDAETRRLGYGEDGREWQTAKQ